MRVASTLVLTGLLFGTLPVQAYVSGPAANYNVFVTGNFTSAYSDTEGNLAAGGNVNLTGYAVASHIPGNPSQSPNPARIVAGGTVTATNGGVGAGQNGAIYAGSTSLSGFTATGGVFTQNQVNFAAAQVEYQNLSTYWGSLAANGTTSVLYGALNLTGTTNGLNIFTVNGSDLTNTNTVNINVPTGATVLVNVLGTGQIFQNGQVFLTGTDPTHVMYNLFQANVANLLGSKNPNGSIMAPWAHISGGYGAMNGQLIAQSFNGNTEFHNFLFAGTLPNPPSNSNTTVPEPAPLVLMCAALLGLALSKPKARPLAR